MKRNISLILLLTVLTSASFAQSQWNIGDEYCVCGRGGYFMDSSHAMLQEVRSETMAVKDDCHTTRRAIENKDRDQLYSSNNKGKGIHNGR